MVDRLFRMALEVEVCALDMGVVCCGVLGDRRLLRSWFVYFRHG